VAVVAGLCIAADPTWNPADAVKEAEQDISQQGISSFIGRVALRPGQSVCRSKWLRISQANAGIGCVTNDIPLRERQEEYARRYNEKIYAYITQKH